MEEVINESHMPQDYDLYLKAAEILRTGKYDELTEYITDNCVLSYPRHTALAEGREPIGKLLQKAYLHDHNQSFPIRLSAEVSATKHLPDESLSEEEHPVIYVHEDVFPPFHKTYVFLKLEHGIITRIDVCESARIKLLR